MISLTLLFLLITIISIILLTINTLNSPLCRKKNKSYFVKSFLFITIFITIPAYIVKMLIFDFSSFDPFSCLFNPFFVSYCVFLAFYSIFMRELSKELFIIQPDTKFSLNFLQTYLYDKIFTKEYLNKVLFYIMIMFSVRILFDIGFFTAVYDYIFEHIQLIKDLGGYLLLPVALYMEAPEGNNNSWQGNGGGAAEVIWTQSQGVPSKISSTFTYSKWVPQEVFMLGPNNEKGFIYKNTNKPFEYLPADAIKFNFSNRLLNKESIDLVLERLRAHPEGDKLNKLPEEYKRYLEHLIYVNERGRHSRWTRDGERVMPWAYLRKGLERDDTTIIGFVVKEKNNIAATIRRNQMSISNIIDNE